MLCQALLEVMDLFGVQQIVFLGRTDKTGRYQIQHLLRIRTSKTVYYQRVHILNVEWILIVVILLSLACATLIENEVSVEVN